MLLCLSRAPGSTDYEPEHVHYTMENALSLLRRVFPDFMTLIHGKEILDYGCGAGFQVVSLATQGAKFVVGLDVNAESLERARELAGHYGVSGKTGFAQQLGRDLLGRFDVVIAKDSMEHFRDPEHAVQQMKTALKQAGMILLTFGPPWLAPYGSHMHFFTKLPWVNLLFSEKTILNVRACFRQDGATRYEDVEGGLNRMTVARFERIVANSGLRIRFRKDEYVKGIRFPGKVPGLRELFTNQVSCILTPDT